ncbi:DUF1851 domain-containing protein [Microbulbifer sp. OS29]|uniref:DUF1851 domain-containing protein n=1 Tax=Microbulbifer okhotskensis TaxID=2926617 RepID=A0A9X2ERE8_9GAMM|nr:T6SS immunity protein Tdi1 domain-containing protein [Microbulbifer okhotskensis]MCO1336992.1 DUF1851 domain-containing protein [Microbulbifer okhotskensis]
MNTLKIFHLSVGSGALREICSSVDEFQALLKDPQFIYDEFVPHVISSFRESEMALGEGQLYSFKILPIFGGEGSIDNIAPCDIEVHFSIFGQMVEQTQSLEPGTPIGSVDLQIPKKKLWWKFWG